MCIRDSPYFRYRVPELEEIPTQGEGSGFVVDPEGYILTNYHVVYGAPGRETATREPQVTVRFADEMTDYPATIVGADEATDLAVLKVERTGLQAVQLGRSADLKVGDWVLAIGNPYHLPATVTVGVVSAVGRHLPQAITGSSLAYSDYIQTDAAINPGNSGGPLVDIYGRVVGVNELIVSPVRGNIGIGFAIPIDIAKDVYEQIRAFGKVTRGWLGITFQTITPDLADYFGTSEGVVVSRVLPDSPAAKAGLKVGDVITAANGTPIVDGRDLARVVAQAGPSQTIVLTILRGGEKRTLTVVTGARPSEAELARGPEPQPREAMRDFTVAPTSSPQAREFDISPDTPGVVVVRVNPNSDAYAKGLRPGHVIQKVNDRDIANLDDFRTAMAKVKPGDKVVMLVRDPEGNTLWMAYRVGGAQ